MSRLEVDHLSVFALAPQPLLVLLGTLLGDIVPADVYQRHREPPTWSWPTTASPLALTPGASGFRRPPGPCALPGATVTRDRIEAVLGPEASVWGMTIPRPNNDFIKSREHLSQFRAVLRPLLDRIKAAHGQTTLLNVFPAAPVSVAVESGGPGCPRLTCRAHLTRTTSGAGSSPPSTSHLENSNGRRN